MQENSTTKQYNELGEKPVGRLLLSYAIPAIIDEYKNKAGDEA